jgi:glycosyltransferase involved in cell wall biosynthesis
VRVLLDYRPALRARTGVGEYVHQLARALARPERVGGAGDEVVVFSSSWKDRLAGSDVHELGPVRRIDLRWPVQLLNLSWHRLEWPPIELLTGERPDVVHSPHPLLLPSRSAAQVVTVHDLDFLLNPSHVADEVRRDYAALARRHAGRADRVIVPSDYTASMVRSRLGVASDRIAVCPEGVAEWAPGSQAGASGRPPGFMLFLGTLEPRKNVPGLLAAYRLLLGRRPDPPPLLLAGKAPASAASLLREIATAPLAGHVEHLGYVQPGARQALYQDARLLILPSFDEGFGLPVVEAMSLGVPVIASNRGALPEVVGDAGLLVDPDDPGSIADAMARVLTDPSLAESLTARGRDRARLFSWHRCAKLTREAYAAAVSTRREGRLEGSSPKGRKA